MIFNRISELHWSRLKMCGVHKKLSSRIIRNEIEKLEIVQMWTRNVYWKALKIHY